MSIQSITKQRTEKFVRKRNVYLFGVYMVLFGVIMGLVYEVSTRYFFLVLDKYLNSILDV